MRAGKEYALYNAALAGGNPARENAGSVGPRTGLSNTKQEAEDEQRRIAERRRGEHGECGPPGDDPGNHGPAPNSIRPPRRGYFECRIGEREGAEHVAHLDL